MSNVIIFGAGGQDGQYLTSYHEARGDKVFGVLRTFAGHQRPMSVFDVADYESVRKLIVAAKPDIVYQLAAKSTVNDDFSTENSGAIVAGTNNVLEACRKWCPAAKVFIPGSGLQLAKEGSGVKPSMYVIQRNAACEMASYYRDRHGVRAYVGYLYNHESPLRDPSHVSMMIAAAAQRVAAGSDETIAVGDPKVVKEWTFAGDVARGMMLFLGQEDAYVTTIASGEGASIDSWGIACFESVGLNVMDWHSRCKPIPNYEPHYRHLVHEEGRVPFWDKGRCLPGIVEMGWKPQMSLRELAGLMTIHVPQRTLVAC